MQPSATTPQPLRSIQWNRPFSLRRFFFQWEWMLVALFLLINVINAGLSPNYLVYDNIMSAIQMFSDKAILVFPMMLVILLGEIDISIASTMALSGVVMGLCFQAGLPMWLCVCVGLLVGTACGFLNGLILAKFPELSSMIVTLSTMIIYRGIASILLEDRAVGSFPAWFQYLGWGYVGSIPFIFLFFLLEAAVFAYLVHCTVFGRQVYAMGNNPVTARYSGVQTARNKIIIFTVMGLFAAVAALFLASKMGSVRPSIAKSYELDVIAMVVLGGVSNAGGKGRVPGVVIATLIVGFLRYGLGIVNVPSQTIMILIGLLLIVAVTIPNLKSTFGFGLRKRRARSSS